MNANWLTLRQAVSALLLGISSIIMSGSLSGCQPQPNSMFEQQAEADAANTLDLSDATDGEVAVVAPVAIQPAADINTDMAIRTIKRQAIAKQPNCDAAMRDCQYFELNVLGFQPEQPWLTSMMWQTIARVMAPETPLASQDETAKKTVLMLFNQIEYSEQVVTTLPMYQRIDTELVLNTPSQSDNQSALAQQSTAANERAETGYLVVRATQHHGQSHRQYVSYVMLDIQKKLQLNVRDILLPHVTTDILLDTFQNAKKDWLTLQGIEQKYHEDWPLQLSRQWYLDAQGLHMVYQSGELLDVETDAVDLMVPYSLLQGLIKPRYIVAVPENTPPQASEPQRPKPSLPEPQ